VMYIGQPMMFRKTFLLTHAAPCLPVDFMGNLSHVTVATFLSNISLVHIFIYI